ncbi:hypothetical protein P175DRAFT_0496950 [Aspergillus ochraceoroseus IBT 24754]|uniref:Yeast cell wall synthesis Kre9/Knh1-like N-terminal domain-containing protein n=3 Tax=Aspergillus subgen. Nidulantes TaxID=2720870 RepID=A0A0F8WY21_9EURO|nr:uncharacterized protein P175DRAFT_0496950 [Aspergillus ochraceoroseus IBT 24754]KKK16232.1 hypothetical protein ARAM_001806 [Aspergillus rambellii]KKK24562.1 hypothetical protein AOCH_000413 [Aspergillus ochraceoroseus]PTU23823.1 hypothetical protein P175DRAFT_0496950 [Aspergillus ochraceoroseus IBT 24754]
MRSVFYVALSTLATLAAAAENAFNIPSTGYQFTAGKATTLSWDPTTSGTVTLKLQWGSVLTDSTGSTIVANLPNSGTYTWSVPSDLVNRSDYSIEIISDSNSKEVNYLPRFAVAGATAVATTTTASSTTTTAATSTATPSTTLTTQSKSHSSTTPATSTSSSTSSTTSTTSSTTSATSVPNTNAGMTNRVSGGLVALVLGALALF